MAAGAADRDARRGAMLGGSAELSSGWDGRLRKAMLLVARLALGYLFFVNLWWKVPPDFNCPPDYAFTSGTPQRLQRTSGLCDWIGVERVWSSEPRTLLDGPGPIGVPIGPVARLNGAFIENVVQPNIRWMGWVIWFSEATAAASLLLGLLTRLGGLVALGLALQLTIGLAGIKNPFEWEWGYNQMVLLSLLMIAFAPGRFLGLDVLLRPRFVAAAARGSRVGRLLLALS